MAGRVISITSARRLARTRSERAGYRARLIVFVLVPVALLVIVGLGTLLSASSVTSIRETGDSLYYFKRQALWAILGVVALLVVARIPYRTYQHLAVPLLFATIAALVVVLAVGDVRGGSQRWLSIGSMSVQPSEFAKFSVVAFLAMIMTRREGSLRSFGDFFWPVLLSLGVVGALVMKQPDMGTTLIIGGAAFAVLMASAAPFRYVFGSAALASVAAAVLAAVAPYRWARITSFLDPFADSLDTGFQAVQSLVALGTGGIFGVGLGLSRARWSFLPNAHTDFIFAIIGEETGFVGVLGVIVLFVSFTVAGTLIALRAADRFGRLLGIGIVAWLSLQAVVNIGGVAGIVPITGVPLPFMSFGGSALMTNLAAVGVLVAIARESREAR